MEDLELVVPYNDDIEDYDADSLTTLPAGVVSPEYAANQIMVAFMNASPIGKGEKTVLKATFKFKEPAAEGEYEFKIFANQFVNKDGEDLAKGLDDAFACTGKIVVKAEAAPTQAPTQAPTTTAKKKPAGEATPWALMATVAVAGAALVVLSTKKSK